MGRKYREASGEHRDTVQNGCETLRVSAIRGSGYVYLVKLKCPPLPSSVRIPNVRHPDGMAAAAGWNSYPGGMWRQPDGIPYSLYSGFAYGFQRTLLNLGLLW